MSIDDDPRALLRALYDAAVARAQPAQVMQPVSAGAAAGAARWCWVPARPAARWPRRSTRCGRAMRRCRGWSSRATATCRRVAQRPGRIEVVEASHPVPDAAGERAAQRIVGLTQGLTADDLVLCLISGGGSALLSLPADGLTLADKQQINQALLASGAAIDEMNCVRKHLSAIKGGRLAARCAPARVVTLLISDVPGDDPSIIASGPTVPDAEHLRRRAGASWRATASRFLRRRKRVWTAEPSRRPSPAMRYSRGHAVHLIATPQQSLEAAAALARERGLDAHILSDEIEGESREVGKVHAAMARAVRRRGQPFARPCVILSAAAKRR